VRAIVGRFPAEERRPEGGHHGPLAQASTGPVRATLAIFALLALINITFVALAIALR
jgi:hypothetical protein